MNKLIVVAAVALATGCSSKTTMSGAEIQQKLDGLSGAGTGVDADTVDGKQATDFAPTAHTHLGTDVTSQVTSAAEADSTPWTGITGLPTTFAPSAHGHDATDILSGVINPARLPYQQLIATALCGAVGSNGQAKAVRFTTAGETGSGICAGQPAAIGASCAFAVGVAAPDQFSSGIGCGTSPGALGVDPSTMFACCDDPVAAPVCPADMERHGVTCVETTSRPAAPFRVALQTCFAAQRQLCAPTVLFAACLEGLVLTQVEHSETVFGQNASMVGGTLPSNCQFSQVNLSDPQGNSVSWPFRCCAPKGAQ